MGETIRVYYPRPYKGAYVFVQAGRVSHASDALAFTIGWPREKIMARAKDVGFKTCIVGNMKSPRDTWVSINPKTKGVKNVD